MAFDKARKKFSSRDQVKALVNKGEKLIAKQQRKLQLDFPSQKPKTKAERQRAKKDLQNWSGE